MPVVRKIHWRTPAALVSSLFAGIALALGHHFLYQTLAGTTVHDTSRDIIGYGISSQQMNIAAGTALAFLVKVCLVLSVTIAYTQVFWKAIGHRETRIDTIDIIDSALGNIFMFLKVRVWWKYPLLLSLALSVWFIPIASTITPATLNVVYAAQDPRPVKMLHVRQADFTSLRFVNSGLFMGYAGRDDSSSTQLWYYNGPSTAAQRVTKTTASLGSIMAIPAPGTNASYEVSFQAPYLRCEPMNATFQAAVQKNIYANYVKASNCQMYYNYLAWTASRGHNDMSSYMPQPLPFDSASPYEMNVGTLGPLQRDNLLVNNQTSTIYFGIMPNMRKMGVAECPEAKTIDNLTETSTKFINATFLQCQLWNTTYRANLNFTGGQQQVRVDFPNLEKRTPVAALSSAYMNTGIHRDLMTNKFVTDGCQTVGGDRATYVDCTVDRRVLETLSFQAIMDSFGSLLAGGVRFGDTFKTTTFVSSTEVLSSSLMSSRELSFFSSGSSWRNNSYTPMPATDQFTELLPQDELQRDVSFKDSVEQLFQNITLSMMSADLLQPDSSSPFAPPPVNVTFSTFQNVYSYSAITLWISYGIAILVTAFAVVIGLCCIWSARASWSDDFSTIMRTTRSADLSVHLAEDDRDGSNPVPKHLVNATISFRSGAFERRHGDVETLRSKTVDTNDTNKRWKQAVFGIRRTDS